MSESNTNQATPAPQTGESQDEVQDFLTKNPDWGPKLEGQGSRCERFAPSVAGDSGAATVGMASKKPRWRAGW